MRHNYRAAIRCGFIALAGVALTWAQPSTHLRVASVSLDPTTHKVTLALLNSTSDKTVVAYILGTKSFDSAGKQIDDSGVGWDFMGPDPNPQADKYILPGRVAAATTFAPAEAVSVQVLVTAVVYLDRTFEGTTAELVFAARAKQAKAAREALRELSFYPEGPGDTRKAMHALLRIRSPLVNGALADKLHLDAVPDADHPPVGDSFPRRQWEDVRTELEQKATFFEAQSEGVKQ